jgi:PPOX class probable F420-dependent enzyme
MLEGVMNPDLAAETYINLETFRRDGTGVRTPVWCAPLGDKIVVFTDGTSYKMKRLRHTTRVRVAACDVRGKLRGEWLEGRCEIVEEAKRAEQIYAALLEKYGFQMRLVNFFSTLSGRIGRRAVLEISLCE